MLERREEFMPQKRIAVSPQSVPLAGIDLIDALMNP
jgi:hypothetical protein